MKYVINGKFLSQKMTGVQRFAKEIVKEIDRQSTSGEIILAVPVDAKIDFELHNISVVRVGRLKGILWEQLSFPFFLLHNKYSGINLGNVAPLVKPDIVCIHDMLVLKYPKWFGRLYWIWSKLLYFNISFRANMVLTVSEFSKNEIRYFLPKLKSDITIISEGWQHMSNIEKIETNILDKNGLVENGYIFANYQLAPYKNFNWILETAKRNPNMIFVITGWHNKKTHKNQKKSQLPRNIRILGYVSDEELCDLIRHCRFFVFPSFCEGFGLPPLEALSMGAKIIVSDIPVMHEIYGDVAFYTDPDDFEIDFNMQWRPDAKNVENILNRFSWEKGAECILRLIRST